MGHERGLPLVIHCMGLTRTYDTPGESVVALDQVDLEVDAGEFVCLHGASGSGKSTLLNMIAGLDSPNSGEVHVGEQLISALSDRERAAFRLRHIGVVFQDHNLLDEFSALDNVLLPLTAMGLPDGDARAEAARCLELLNVLELKGRLPAEMSGGQRQRVGIARCIVGGRQVLLADEPTGSLDSVNSRELFSVLQALCAEGRTAIVATHDPLAASFASRVVTMEDGRVV